MTTCHLDEDNLIAGREFTDPVHDQHIEQWPAFARNAHNFFDALLSHARVVFQVQTGHRLALVAIAHQADECGNRP